MNSFFNQIPTFRRFFHWLTRPLLSQRFWTRAAFVAACLLTCIAIYYAEERWRWHRAWNAYAADARKRGVRLDPSDFARPKVPDSENFAMIPYLKDFYQDPEPPTGIRNGPVFAALIETPLLSVLTQGIPDPEAIRTALVEQSKKQRSGNSNNPTALSLDPAQVDILVNHPDAPVAEIALTLLDEECGSVWEQLRGGLDLPLTRFPVDLENDVLNAKFPLARIYAAAQLAGIRLALHSSVRNGDAAFEDFQVCMRLVDATRDEPTLVCATIRSVTAQLAAESLWTGFAEHVWDDATLSRIDALLAKTDLIATCRLGFEGERMAANVVFEQFAAGNFSGPNPWPHNVEKPPVTFWNLFPKGWFYFNQLLMNRFLDQHVAISDPTRKTSLVLKDFAPDSEAYETSFKQKVYPFLIMTANYTYAATRAVWAEAMVRQARTACALERYRLLHGTYPEQLNTLVTEKLLPAIPHDPASDVPMEYRITTDGMYALEAPATVEALQYEFPWDHPTVWMPVVVPPKVTASTRSGHRHQ